MVDVLDVEVRVLLVDQLPEGRVVLVAVVGDGREARGELGERLGGRLRAGELLVVEGDGAVEVLHRDEALVEATLGDGAGGPACDSAAWASSASPAMPSSVAMASAHTPWCDCGWISWRCGLLRAHRQQALACSDIISVPPAMTRSSMPDMHRGGGDVVGGDARAAEPVERDAAGA